MAERKTKAPRWPGRMEMEARVWSADLAWMLHCAENPNPRPWSAKWLDQLFLKQEADLCRREQEWAEAERAKRRAARAAKPRALAKTRAIASTPTP
jgi:hypothetical protein